MMSHSALESTTSLLLLPLADLLVLQHHVLRHLNPTFGHCGDLGIRLIWVFLLALLLLSDGLFSDLGFLLLSGVGGLVGAHLDYCMEEFVDILTSLRRDLEIRNP